MITRKQLPDAGDRCYRSVAINVALEFLSICRNCKSRKENMEEPITPEPGCDEALGSGEEGAGEGVLAAVFHEAKRPLEFCLLPQPQLQPRETLVRVVCCTLCGSDLHTIAGRRNEWSPSILGHEILGVVEEVSDEPPLDLHGEPLKPGDRITWSICVSCGRCDRCQGGLPQKCRHLHKYGHGKAEGRFALSGGLAEAILLRPDSTIIKVPNELPDHVACPANCATATVMAAFNAIGSVEGKRVLLLGAGLLGLTAVAVAKCRGAYATTVSDPAPERLSLAQKFGADVCIESSGFDVVMDFSGSVDAIESAIECASIGAKIVLVGSVMKCDDMKLNPEQIIRKCWQIHGIHNYAPADLLDAVQFLREHHQSYPFAELVSAEFSLEQIDHAIRYAEKNRPIRVAVRPGLSHADH